MLLQYITFSDFLPYLFDFYSLEKARVPSSELECKHYIYSKCRWKEAERSSTENCTLKLGGSAPTPMYINSFMFVHEHIFTSGISGFLVIKSMVVQWVPRLSQQLQRQRLIKIIIIPSGIWFPVQCTLPASTTRMAEQSGDCKVNMRFLWTLFLTTNDKGMLANSDLDESSCYTCPYVKFLASSSRQNIRSDKNVSRASLTDCGNRS
jgi:hypothetical protein